MKVIILPNIDPEVLAMLQALYSRSHKSVESYLEQLNYSAEETSFSEKIKTKLQENYIGYGHSSIADCANVPIFIEGVSLIAAKAIQDTPLYNGQETSTRYIDFSSQKNEVIKNHVREKGLSSELNLELQESMLGIYQDWINLYKQVGEAYFKYLVEELQIPEDDKKKIKTAKLKSFDIARAFLPAGVETQLSFYGSLRNIREHFLALKRHPLAEVRDIALKVLSQMLSMYPHSFKVEDASIIEERDILSFRAAYPKSPYTDVRVEADSSEMRKFIKSGNFKDRLGETLGIISFSASDHDQLDYGSWRDLQRHRRGYCKPVIPTFVQDRYRLNSFYVQEIMKLPNQQAIFDEFWCTMEKLSELKRKFILNDMGNISYTLPLGLNVDAFVSYHINQWKYVLDLRLRDTVHPSLIQFLINFVEKIRWHYPDFYDLYEKRIGLLKSGSLFNEKRADQDIVKK